MKSKAEVDLIVEEVPVVLFEIVVRTTNEEVPGSIDNWLVLFCRFAEFLIGSFLKGKTGDSAKSSNVDWSVVDVSFISLTLAGSCGVIFPSITFIGALTVDVFFFVMTVVVVVAMLVWDKIYLLHLDHKDINLFLWTRF